MTVIPKFGQRIRVTADNVQHLRIVDEAGQIRGLPLLTPSIVALWMLDLYDDAELDRKKTAALFSIFIKRPDPDGEFFDKAMKDAGQVEGPSEGDWENRNGSDVQLAPGVAHTLFPGEDVVPAQPAESGHSYDPFQYRTLTRICAGIGQPYAGVTWDLVKANYSNMRGALIEARRRTEIIQKNVFIFQFCKPAFRWFLDAAHLAGGLDFDDYAENPAPYLNADWLAPPWMWLDPEKDVQGEVLQVNAGFKPRSTVIEERGGDPIEVDNRIAADKNRADKLGLTFSGTASVRGETAAAPTASSDEAEAESNSGQPPEEEGSSATPAKSPAPKSKPKKPANATVN
jgi:lambda family phage portal protein